MGKSEAIAGDEALRLRSPKQRRFAASVGEYLRRRSASGGGVSGYDAVVPLVEAVCEFKQIVYGS